MRIAVIGPRGVPSNYSGIERIVENLFGYMSGRGHHVTVYCRPQVQQQKLSIHKGIRTVRTAAPGGKNFETLSHSFSSMLHAVLRGDVHDGGRKFDLISMHAVAPNLAVPIAKAAGITVVSHVHGLDHLREKWKGIGARIIGLGEKTMVAMSDAVVTVNRDIVRHYQNEYGLTAELLPNGIHITPDHLPPDAATLQRFGLVPGRFLVSIGRLVPEKRLHDTIAAFSRLQTDFKLAIVGEGPHTQDYVDALKSQAKASCGDRVVFTGLQNHEPLETLFRHAFAYVTASELEGLPSSLLECMERGTCAIVSDIPPHRELLGEIPGYGFFFKPGEVDLLAAHLAAAIGQPQRVKAIGAASRRFVRGAYAWPVLAEKTEAFYQSILDRR
jgi:glycosyltransferase involved in cell wall biosynthesis